MVSVYVQSTKGPLNRYTDRSSATLVLPVDVTTPHDSFCLFAWNYRELANSLLTLYDKSEGGFEPGTLWTRVKWSNHSGPSQPLKIISIWWRDPICSPGYQPTGSLATRKLRHTICDIIKITFSWFVLVTSWAHLNVSWATFYHLHIWYVVF